MIVVLCVLDSLRADHLSCYGYKRNTTPNIDSIAKEGVIFANAYSQSTFTRPVMASILTSTYPCVHSIWNLSDRISKRIIMLQQVLKNCGFFTSAISPNYGSLRFETSFDKCIDPCKNMSSHDKGTKYALKEAFSLLARTHKKKSNLFMLFWSMETHLPYFPPLNFRKFIDSNYDGEIDGSVDSIWKSKSEKDFNRLINLYDSEISYSDYCIGQLKAKLIELNEYEDTLFIITSDHGEAFNEHNIVFHLNIPYEELIHIPLIIKFPKSTYKSTKVNELVQLIDIMPTIMDLLSLKKSGILEQIQGKNMLEILDSNKEINEYVYSQTVLLKIKSAYSVQSKKWKYISVEAPKWGTIKKAPKKYLEHLITKALTRELPTHFLSFLRRSSSYLSFTNKEMLFDIEKNRKEVVNQSNKRPKIMERLSSELHSWMENNRQLSRKYPKEEEILDEDAHAQMEDRLRKLGYL